MGNGKEIDTKTINTNTENTLHQLDKIFDKKKIEERQELARLFAKNAFEEVHRLSDKYHWKEGGPEKVALHAAIGEITAQLAGNPNGSGAVASGINELAIKKIIDKVGKEHPDQAQMLSAALGVVVNKVLGKPSTSGGAVSVLGTKFNDQKNGDNSEGMFATFDDAANAAQQKLAEEQEGQEFDIYSEDVYGPEYKTEAIISIAPVHLAAKLGIESAKSTGEYRLAGILLEQALTGAGDMHFYEGSLASQRLSNDYNTRSKLYKAGKSIPVGTTRPFYISVDTDYGGNHYAFGRIKLVANISHNYDGSVSASGYGTDNYDFNNAGSSGIGNLIVTSAYELQRCGLLKPYVYTVDFSVSIYG